VVLEAARQDPGALPHAAPELWEDPVLQQGSLRRNCVAGRGARAPLLCLRGMAQRPDGIFEASVICGLGGSEASLPLPGESPSVGDLASAAVRHFGVAGGLVHLQVQGHGRIGVFDLHNSLSEVLCDA